MTRHKDYLIDGRAVTISWELPRLYPVVYTIVVDGAAPAGLVEKTALGRYHVFDRQGRRLGTCLGMREALTEVLRSGISSPANTA